MAQRTFGWVQNPNKLTTLKYITGIFLHNSYSNKDLLENRLPLLDKYNLISKENYKYFSDLLDKEEIEIGYDILKGSGAGGKSRKDALCSGIIQASITAHSSSKEVITSSGEKIKIKKPYVDDWTSDGYLRWAISTGLLIYDNDSDTCKISELGIKLVLAEENSSEEKDAFTFALLSYPPVYRVLEILSDHKLYTKFEIGDKLGFKGEMGFTSIPQEIFVYDYCSESSTSKRKDIKQNEEGDADKYARTIANWLVQMGWVEKENKEVEETYYGIPNKMTINAYRITREGEKAIIKSNGNSSNAKIPKIVKFEMLATKVPNANYIRLRRTHILNCVRTEKTIEQIQRYLKSHDMDEPIETIIDELKNMHNIGICINQNGDRYRLTDKIVGLEIPVETVGVSKDMVTDIKDRIRGKLKHINHDYLVLVDLAYSDSKAKQNSDARDFEIKTAKLLTKELDFQGERLGDANKPDVIIYYDKYGTIIDNKSYSDGFSVDKHCADEMSRYVNQNNQRVAGIPPNEWWKRFDSNVSYFTFLFVTSFLKGRFKENLEEISGLTGVKGGAINIENLLYMAESLKSGATQYTDFFSMFNNNEITMAM